MGDNRTVQTAHHNPISLAQDTVREDNIDGGTETFDDLDFKNGTLQLGKIHEPVAHALLGEVDEQHDHVGYTFASDGGCWHERDVPREVLVIVVKDGVQTLFCEGHDGFSDTLFELALDMAGLLSEGVTECVVWGGLPAIDTIDLSKVSEIVRFDSTKKAYLVQRNNKRRLPISEQPQRL